MRSGITPITRINDFNLWFSASFYLSEGQIFHRKLERMNSDNLSDLLERQPFYGGRSKRIYVDSQEMGIPYLSNSDLQRINPLQNCKYISKKLTDNLEEDILEKGWTLVSRVGTIGQVSYVHDYLVGVAGSDNMIRLAPSNSIPSGYLYAFMSSPVGIALMEQIATGAVQSYIDSKSLSKIQIPRLGLANEQRIHNLIEESSQKLQRANTLINRSQVILHSSLFSKFPPFKILGRDLNHFDYGEVSSKDINSGNLRLNASFYVNQGIKVRQWLKKITKLGEIITEPLSKVTKDIFYGSRFSRTYVDDNEKGIPFLSSSDMLRLKFNNVKFLSITQTSKSLIDDLKIRKGWTLLSRSGTIGNTVYVRSDMDGFTSSEHIIRVVPDEKMILQGYLFAVLSSDFGYLLLTKGTYGTVVQHIEPKHISDLPIPRIDLKIEEQIHKFVEEASRLRVEAKDLEIQAQNILSSELLL